MMRVLPAFEGHSLVFVTTNPLYRAFVPQSTFYAVSDSNLHQKIKLIESFWSLVGIFRREKPHIVFTTGAAPGLCALIIGKMTGAKTIWLDSLANSEKLSLSGRLAGLFADLWLTQWPNLAKTHGPLYGGNVL